MVTGRPNRKYLQNEKVGCESEKAALTSYFFINRVSASVFLLLELVAAYSANGAGLRGLVTLMLVTTHNTYPGHDILPFRA